MQWSWLLNRIRLSIMGKKILIIARCYTGPGPNVLRRQSLARYILGKGGLIDILGYEKEDSLPVDAHYYQSKMQVSLVFLKWFFTLFFRYLYLLKAQSMASYVRRLGLAAMTMVSAEKLIKIKEYDTCLVCIHPWAFYLIIPYLVKRVPTVIDISDPLYKNAINLGSDNRANFRLEQTALMAATHVVTMNEPTIQIMTDEMGINSKKITFVSPAMNVSSYVKDVHKSFPLHNPIRMIYVGSLYANYRDFGEIQPAIDNLHGLVSMDVFSNSGYTSNDSDNISRHDVVPHKQVLQLYSQYDIILFVDNFYGYQVPSKIFEVMAQNKPILFVYDKRNTYFYEKLKNQKGIIFVENKRDEIERVLTRLCNSNSLSVNYTFDLNDYSEQATNKKLWKCLFNQV